MFIVPAAEASTSAMSLEEEVLEIDLIDDNDTSGNASTEIDTAVDEATPQNVTEPVGLHFFSYFIFGMQ